MKDKQELMTVSRLKLKDLADHKNPTLAAIARRTLASTSDDDVCPFQSYIAEEGEQS